MEIPYDSIINQKLWDDDDDDLLYFHSLADNSLTCKEINGNKFAVSVQNVNTVSVSYFVKNFPSEVEIYSGTQRFKFVHIPLLIVTLCVQSFYRTNR